MVGGGYLNKALAAGANVQGGYVVVVLTRMVCVVYISQVGRCVGVLIVAFLFGAFC
jgi:hypothetical protein